MSTTSFIKRHIFHLSVNQIFTTRELLLYGTRTAVDQALSKLVKKQWIIRLARGVFVKQDSDVNAISLADIARAKAQAFGKQLATWGGNLALKLHLVQGVNQEHTYYVNASSSSFKCRDTTIYFKRACPRKMRFHGASRAGTFLGALWHMGRQQLPAIQVRHRWLPWSLNRLDKEEVRVCVGWLPAWLGDCFVHWTLPRTAWK